MHIALCHDSIVPPPNYGGTERVMAWLARALIQLGHQVTLIALPGSAIPGARFIAARAGVSWEEQTPRDVDLIHLWASPALEPKRPYLVTIGGIGKPGESFRPHTVFVSRKHAENHGAIDFVHNGIDPDEYPCDSVREENLVFLAKAAWKVKNLNGAIALARASGRRLDVLGSRNWWFGLHHLRPTWRGVRYHGMVGDQQKREILRNARALVFAVRWHEPFGVAITEALASGCAVLGTPYGALPEIVTSEVGVLSAHPSQLLSAMENLNRFDPKICRARVYEGFTHLDMARKYLVYYQSILNSGRLSSGAPEYPRTNEGLEANRLLPWGD